MFIHAVIIIKTQKYKDKVKRYILMEKQNIEFHYKNALCLS